MLKRQLCNTVFVIYKFHRPLKVKGYGEGGLCVQAGDMPMHTAFESRLYVFLASCAGSGTFSLCGGLIKLDDRPSLIRPLLGIGPGLRN